MTDAYTVILVYSTSHAIKIEKLLAAAGTDCKLIPVPRHLSSDCGVCVRINSMDEKKVRAFISDWGLEVQGFFSEKH